MSLYDEAKTRARVASVSSEEFEAKAGVHQGSIQLPPLFATVVNITTENARRGVVSEVL